MAFEKRKNPETLRRKAREMILALSNERDGHFQYVKEKIERMGEKVVLCDFSQYPADIGIGFEINGNGEDVHFELGGLKFTGREIRSVWNRRKSQPTAPTGLKNEKVKEYIAHESQFFIDSLPQILNVLWVSKPDAISVASRKPHQLMVARKIGFQIPLTIIGNSQPQTRIFLDSLNDKIAVKTLGVPHISVQTETEEDALILYNRCKDKSELLPLMENVRNCPAIFQQYIKKEFELRITVVGNKVFPCAIYSQQSERTREDWRRYDIPNTPHKIHNLPADIETKCITLVRELGLMFGCMDMIVTPDGEYVFLEINPNGQWLWIERLTDMPIGECLAEMLVAG